MRILILFIILLLAVIAHADEKAGNPAPLEEQLKAVERQLVENGLQPEEAIATIQAMSRARFTEEQMVRAGMQINSDNGQGLIAGAVRAKIHEGIAKGIPPETILTVTAKIRNRYEFAEKLSLELNQAQLAQMFADCMTAGFTEKDVRKLATTLQTRMNTPGTGSNQNLAVETLLTARDMGRQGATGQTTVEVLEAALNGGYNQEGMRAIRQALGSDIGDRLENAARRIAEAIGQGAAAETLQGIGNRGAGAGDTAGTGQGQGSSGGGGNKGNGPGGR